MGDYQQLVQQSLEQYYKKLNAMQRQAVFQINGPLLILAGAGSGKTTVLIQRIDYMVRFGNAYHGENPPVSLLPDIDAQLRRYAETGEGDLESLVPTLADRPVAPWNILAITFTNKAAQELQNRLGATLGAETAADIQASTFHSLCMRILRRHIDKLGYSSSFTIYDTDDSLRVIRDGIRALNLDEKVLTPRSILSAISRSKDEMRTPEERLKETEGDYREHLIAKVYHYYQGTLKSANALDFDDIIVLTVELFQQFPEVLEYYQNRYRYIMVDEYQDTNQVQYLLVSMIAAKHQNLCVVGDDDQSIYKFRGATIENILSFEDQFREAKVIRLEQNYRSTQNILTAANHLIQHNTARKGKNLWTDAGDGEQVSVVTLADETMEARYIADSIMKRVEEGGRWSDHAVLYRMNAQSGAIERALTQRAIPYRMVGGLRFYERKEIKDVVAYLSVLNNPLDDLRLARIINEPRRGIGTTTIDRGEEISQLVGEPLYTVFAKADQYAPLSRTSGALLSFIELMEELKEEVDVLPLDEFLDLLLEKTGYLEMLKAEGKEGEGRIENVLELKSNMIQYEEAAETPSLGGFLEEISLYTDLDSYEVDADAATLMTIHAAKGLEFPHVYLVGLEEGIFPGRNAMDFPEELEEERRLAYVAITRAKEKITLTGVQRRMLFGKTMWGRPSRFVGELPSAVVELEESSLERRVTPSAPPPQTSHARTSMGQTAAPRVPAGPKVEEGDRVSHKVFGEGTVRSAKPMGGDTLVEIEFDTAGKKKIMANFARITKL